jgi:SAM-dependent methyltransferase
MQSMSATLSSKELPKAGKTTSRGLESVSSVELRCPSCHESLGHASYSSLAKGKESFFCGRCMAPLAAEDGIWLALPAVRERHFARFVKEYEHIRREEGRGSERADFYLALPHRDLTGRNSWQWGIRGKTFRYIEGKVLPELRRKKDLPLAILDLGAGNGWMSHRLARLGHRPIAVDLLSNSYDGLGAATHYQSVLPELFPRFQAELDNLPFAAEQFDCAIFNASFHYSESYDRTLGEVIRCLRRGGTVLIADSPSYSREAWGQQMREERKKEFEKRYGFRADGLESGEYLTPERLIALEASHDLEWKAHGIWYGIDWACRPWVAKWRKRREPSQFILYSAQVKTR